MKQGGKRSMGSAEHSPKVSVICVTLNAEATLSQMLASYKLYSSDDTELVIIDGDSVDGTLKLIKENEYLIDFWISGPDSGIYDAMNKAINYVKGNWLIFLGADDNLEAGFNKSLPFLKDQNSIYYGNVIYYGNLLSKIYDDYYLTKLNICHQAIFYPRAVFQKYKYDLKYKVYADYYLNLRCWSDKQFKFEHINHTVSTFSKGGFSTLTKDHIFEKDRDNLFKVHLKAVSYYRYLNRTLGFWKMLKKLIVNQ